MKIEWQRLKPEHLEMVMNWRMLPEITKYMNTDPQLTLEKQRAWFKSIRHSDKVIFWVVYVDGEPVGVVNLCDIDRVNKRCEWGYYIAEKRFRSLKLAVALELNLYQYVFETLKLNRLYNEVMAFNKQVVKLHELCGSRVEGVLKQHVCKNGKFYDVVLFGVLADEWPKIKCNISYEKARIEDEEGTNQ